MEDIYESLDNIKNICWVEEFNYEIIWHFSILSLGMIKVFPSHRGEGKGTEIMNNIISIANENGLSIRLIPDDRFGTPAHVLERFYENLGFKWDSSSSEYVHSIL